MKVVIAGIRYEDPEQRIVYDDYAFVCKAIKNSGYDITQVVSGKAIGVDSLGERWAAANGIDVEPFPADWSRHGKAAGPIRNREMAKHCDAAVIIWDGKSNGTRKMIENMTKLNKPYYLAVTKMSLEDFIEMSGKEGL